MKDRYLPGRDDYSDIIDLTRPVSPKHPPMSREKRAAQFSPFAALTGFESAVEKAALRFEEEAEKGGMEFVLPEIPEDAGGLD